MLLTGDNLFVTPIADGDFANANFSGKPSLFDTFGIKQIFKKHDFKIN